MDLSEFRKAYPILAATLGAEFGDSAAHDDEGIARKVASAALPAERAAYLIQLLNEAPLLLENIDDQWPLLAKDVNRRLHNKDEARKWLLRIFAVWEKELDRLNSES